MRTTLERFLASPRVALLAVLVAVGLNLPSLTTGWHLDDVLHRAQFLKMGPLVDSSDMTTRMFDFLSGDAEEILAYKDIGVLPWWTYDSLKIAFWRPLSSLTHVLDYALWPDSGPLMHAHSLLWLVLLIAAVTRLYQRALGVSVVAGLAAVLYALDDARGLPVGFLANRNAIIATSFGALSLVSLDRWRRDGWRAGSVLSPLAFAAGLLAGESGVGAAPYILGYALFLEPKRGLARWLSIAPHAVIGIVWLSAYELAGYGTFGSGFYLDPIGQPSEWLSHFVVRAPLLLLGQWFLPPSSFALLWTQKQSVLLAVAGAGFLALVLSFLRFELARDPVARFFAFGMLLSVVPITAGYPHDRLLFFVGIGATALLAMLLLKLFDRPRTASLAGRAFGWALLVVHVVIAAPLQVLMTTAMAAQEPLYAGPARSLPDDPKLTTQRLVIVNPPSFFYGQYTLLVRRLDGKPAPESMLLLGPGSTKLTVARFSDKVVTVEADEGFLGRPFDDVFRARSLKMEPGYRVRLSGVDVEVLAVTESGQPRTVAFSFEPGADDERFRWVRYDSGALLPFWPPDVGKSTELEAVPFDLLSPQP